MTTTIESVECTEVEMSRIISLKKLENAEGPLKIVATPEECARLAKRLDVESIDSFEMICSVRWRQSHGIDHDVFGEIHAKLTQSCVISGAPIPDIIHDSFSFRVAHPNQEELLQEELNAFEDIEFSKTDEIDVGEIATQYLILALNPYPKSEVVDVMKTFPDAEIIAKKNPFAVLEKLKTDKP